jgi:sulfite exporter TauE/SafE
MSEYWPVFLAGMAGSMHCVGMCGGFACALGRDARGPAATLGRHLIYNLGRLTSYGFLGALTGYLGFLLVAQCGDDSTVSLVQRAFAVLSGALLVFVGLQFAGVFAHAGFGAIGLGAQALARALGGLLRAPGAAAPLALGVLNGWLPCPLVYAMAAQAAASGGPRTGASLMLVFGLGTFPALLILGATALWRRNVARRPAPHPVAFAPSLRPAALPWRVQGVRLAGALIVLLGLVTLARGLLPLDAHGHLL